MFTWRALHAHLIVYLARIHAWLACMFICSHVWHACTLICSHFWWACMLICSHVWHAWMLICSHFWWACMLMYLRSCHAYMLARLVCLCTHMCLGRLTCLRFYLSFFCHLLFTCCENGGFVIEKYMHVYLNICYLKSA